MGDWRYFWPENIGNYIHFPSAWDSTTNTGLGKSALNFLWINSYLNFTTFFSNFGLSWNLINLIFWFLPAVLLSFFSAFFLFDNFFKNRFRFLAGFIYLFNTYFLIILTGGQLGVALSYSLAPLVLLFFIKTFEDKKINKSILAGLFLSIQIIFDPRVAILTLIPVLLFGVINFDSKKFIRSVILDFIIPLITSIFINFYWILPLTFSKSSPIPSGYDSLNGLKFFSFAFFENSISLLQPNWPENIFGKVYFMRPEFLILPIIAYSSLLFINKIKQKKIILSFSLLGIVGAFLAKGTNPPFEEIYTFLFSHLSFLSMFRDPTKWYMIVALSYSILIPFSVWQISNFLKDKKRMFSIFFQVIIIFYLLFLIRPIFQGQLGFIFRYQTPPKEYASLTNFILRQDDFFRTLSVPDTQRFIISEKNHPLTKWDDIYIDGNKNYIQKLKDSKTEKLFQDLSIKYLIVPYDSEKEIFLEDRKYSEAMYMQAVQVMKKISWLKLRGNFGKIVVFEVQNIKPHFYIYPNIGQKSIKISEGRYLVRIEEVKKNNLLIFSEGYDKNWIADVNGGKIRSTKYDSLINSFSLPSDFDGEISVYYQPQKWVNIGLAISGFTFFYALFIVVLNRKK